MLYLAKKVIRLFKKHGFVDGCRIIIQKLRAKKVVQRHQRDLFNFYDYVNFPKVEARLSNANIVHKKIIWFIPDFDIGSGGHLNIFRMIYNLEEQGISSDLVICGKSQWINESLAKHIISTNFFPLKCDIYFLEKYEDLEKIKGYQIAFATSWQTAYYVNAFGNCIRKAYFVQDFEPYFYALGSNYAFAENTYKFGFDGVTAGSWLSDKLINEYGMRCISFSFSFEENLYMKKVKKDVKKRVFFYARPPTDRRGFELGLFVLNKLYEKDNSIEIVFAGWDVSNYEIPFVYKSLGVVDTKDLSDIYAQCSVALVLSFTNLSLLPLELLASGCPVVINEGVNNDWIDPDRKLMVYSQPNVDDMVKALSNVLEDKVDIDWNYIECFLKKTSWGRESKKVFEWIQDSDDKSNT